MTSMSGCTVSVISPDDVRRLVADDTRDSAARIAGWVPGYSDTDRAAALHARAKSASTALCSTDIGSTATLRVVNPQTPKPKLQIQTRSLPSRG